jgi:phage tail sheath protein FI
LTIYHTPGVYFERRDVGSLAIGLPRSDIAGFVGVAMRGPLFEPVKVESWKQFVSVFGDFIAQGYLAYAVYGFFANGGRTCWISRVADRSSEGTARGEFGGILVSATSPGSWGNGIHVRPFLLGSDVVALLLRFPDGSEQYLRGPFEDIRAPRDNLFDLAQESLDTRLSVQPLVSVSVLEMRSKLAEEGFLTGGADGLADLKPEHFQQAFEELAKITEIGIVATPDLMPKLKVTPKFKRQPPNCCSDQPSLPVPPVFENAEFSPDFGDGQIQDLQMALAANAQALRYRFAILDAGGERSDPRQANAWRKLFSETSFAALYYPWILVDDPLRITGLVRAVPPSGHIAGIYARSDRRRGVHKPPMNEVLEAVSDVRFAIDDTDHGELNDNNVNAIRVMPGRGVRVMGARTLWRDILLRYVNVRRLLSMIEKALEQSLNWTVFEPNNPQLWGEIDRLVRSFLESLFRSGMLDGITSEEAYFVRCDEKTNPPSETELAHVICEVGIQPPYPAEFVVVTIGITKDGVQIREAREQNA